MDVNRVEMRTHNVSKVDLCKGEGFKGRAREPDCRLDVFLQELLHVHPKERPGLLQHLNMGIKTEDVNGTIIKQTGFTCILKIGNSPENTSISLTNYLKIKNRHWLRDKNYS